MKVTTVINTSTKSLLKVFESRGHSADGILSSVTAEAKSLFVPGGRLEIGQMWEIWDKVYQLTDDTIALRAAEILPVGAYGVLDYWLLASPTLGHVFSKLNLYYRLVNSGAELFVQNHKNLVFIELHNPPETPPEHLKRSAEYTFAVFLQRFRLATEKQMLKPFRIDFAHQASPLHISYYQKMFQTSFRFNQATNCIFFERELLEVPLPQADAGLCEMLEHYADRLLSKIPTKDDLVETVRQVLRSRLRGGDISINSTARSLAISIRGLQRRLNANGTSYQAVLDQLRCELAFDYLLQSIDVREIAYLLGFSEPSAFSRAFKSWTGKTPQDIKQNGDTS